LFLHINDGWPVADTDNRWFDRSWRDFGTILEIVVGLNTPLQNLLER